MMLICKITIKPLQWLQYCFCLNLGIQPLSHSTINHVDKQFISHRFTDYCQDSFLSPVYFACLIPHFPTSPGPRISAELSSSCYSPPGHQMPSDFPTSPNNMHYPPQLFIISQSYPQFLNQPFATRLLCCRCCSRPCIQPPSPISKPEPLLACWFYSTSLQLCKFITYACKFLYYSH